MIKIGLTGATGSGKSLICKELRNEGAFIVDCDEIAHNVIKKGKKAYYEIIEHFPSYILDKEKNIIRKRLASLVFKNRKELDFLNKCTHKYINKEVLKKVKYAQIMGGYQFIVIDAPLLMDSGLDKECDEIWVVYADEETRIQRIMKRDKITYELAKNRISSQKTWEEYKAISNIIID